MLGPLRLATLIEEPRGLFAERYPAFVGFSRCHELLRFL
jgi:hypothetical protein